MSRFPISGHDHDQQTVQAFEEAVAGGDEAEVQRLAGLVWNCTDCMPGSLCSDLDMPPGSTYAQGARKVRLG